MGALAQARAAQRVGHERQIDLGHEHRHQLAGAAAGLDHQRHVGPALAEPGVADVAAEAARAQVGGQGLVLGDERGNLGTGPAEQDRPDTLEAERLHSRGRLGGKPGGMGNKAALEFGPFLLGEGLLAGAKDGGDDGGAELGEGGGPGGVDAGGER